MPVTLQVTNGPSAGRKVLVTRGQVAKFGRTEWADISFPADSRMADIHFAIHEDGENCVIKDSSEGIGTLVNGEAVSEARLHTGDIVTAGETAFSVAIDGEAAPIVQSVSETDAAAGNSSQNPGGAPSAPLAADYCRPLKLSDPAKELLSTVLPPADYLELLVQNELYPDALRFLAFWLPRPVAVAWGCDCVEQTLAGHLTPVDQQALVSAKAWSNEPNEHACRAAEQAAITADYEGAPAWLALGAFWSGGSLAPADLPAVPPGEALAAEAISAALTMAATSGQPQLATERYRSFLKAGRESIPLIETNT